MNRLVLAVVLAASGCVSTATLNKKVDVLAAKLRVENAVLRNRVRQVEQTNDALLSQATVQTRITQRLVETAKFLFGQDRALHQDWLELGLRVAQTEKNVAVLRKRVGHLRRELTKIKEMGRRIKDLLIEAK